MSEVRTPLAELFDLTRFVDAQKGVFSVVLAEIARGAKRSHWMWFIFPQIYGLGQNEMATRYGIRSLEEARAYLDHPILGARLHACVAALQDLTHSRAVEVFGAIDAMKLRSSLTLFQEAGGGLMLTAAIDRWFDGETDGATLALLAEAACDHSEQVSGEYEHNTSDPWASSSR